MLQELRKKKNIIESLNQIIKAMQALWQGMYNAPEGADYYPVPISNTNLFGFEIGGNWDDTEKAEESVKNTLGRQRL